MIINASPLIIFSKLNKIDILKNIYKSIEITKSVYEEVVVNGTKINATDAFIAKEYVDNKLIRIHKLKTKFIETANKIMQIYSIDLGEAETIALALQFSEKEVIIDEISAREAAKSLGIKPVGSLRVLLLAYKKDLITKSEIKRLIVEMENTKYRLSPQVLLEFWKLLDQMSK